MDGERYVLQVYVGSLSRLYEALSIEASKTTSAEEIVECIAEKLALADGAAFYELAEVMGNQGGQDCKERRLGHAEYPVALQLLWPKKATSGSGGDNGNGSSGGSSNSTTDFKFALRRKLMGNLAWSLSMSDSNDSQLIRDYFYRFIYQPRNSEYPDLCQLPDLTDQTLLENLKARFEKGHIYTYVGSILIAVNPFTFFPIYNPKYVQLYQNRRLGDLPPHIFAIADAAYQSMLRKRTNQCIVISGESGSGKTESTNLLLHHLTALSQKGTHGSGVEQTILGAGPVLEAFGNAKTKFNNNSSRFGKFIQVNYKENGAVHGALVQKYLLEKSRIVSQVTNERNYHVFYYLLDGLADEEKEKLHLTKPQDYFYLNQSKCYTLEGVDERHEFSRLTQSMEMVGFSRAKQSLCFRVLSAVLHLGNVQFSKKSVTYHSDETVMISNPEEVAIISQLLTVKEETLTAALTCKRTKAAKGEMLVINYKLPDAIATRDAMAKCLYGALFDWIVMQVNHALLSKKDPREHKGNSIGVLDIFGFEDFGDHNNFEQFCINYANERLQYYFNQHVFKYEQEEYQREGISWRNIDFNDNTECLRLIEDKPDGLLYLLDDQCNFPCGSNETVLQKFIYHHNSNCLFEVPPCRGSAFTIKHYAGKVKYQIRDFREKNLDLMRPDIVSVLKVSQMAFVRELVCADPLALFRWQILKAFFKAYFLFSKLRELSKMKRGLTDAYLIKEFSSTNRRRTLGINSSANNVLNNNSSSSSNGNALNNGNSLNQQLSRTMSSDPNHRSLSKSTSSTTSSSTIYEKEAAGDAAAPLHATAEARKSASGEIGASGGGGGGGGGHRITKALLTRQALFGTGGGTSSFGTSSSATGGGSSFGGSFFSSGQTTQPNSSNPGQCVHGALMRTSSSSAAAAAFSCPVHGSQAHLCSTEARLLSRANKILMKKKYSNTYHHGSGHHGSGSGHHLWRRGGFEKSIRNFKLLKQLLGPPIPVPTSSSSSSSSSNLNLSHHVLVSTSSANSISSSSLLNVAPPPPRPARKQTPTVTHQFQQSLQQLMDTLSHANPFFVRCIKSNAEKMPNHFDDKLVLMQLRYTGMLETVRIRQSGYSVRLTFDEFIQHYRILLPKGLLSSKMDVQQFLLGMKLAPNMYQIGNTKVFMRESEKLVLDERLHEEILRRIINLQRWVRTWLCRKRFSEMRSAAIVIQTYARRFIAQRRLSQLKRIAQYENWAANCIQKHWRAYRARQWFTSLRRSVVNFQAHCRGSLLRGRMHQVVEGVAKERAEAEAAKAEAEAAEAEAEAARQRLQQQQQLAKKKSVSVSAIRAMPPTASASASDSAYRENIVDTTLTPLLSTFSVSGGGSRSSPAPPSSSSTTTATAVSEMLPTITTTTVVTNSSVPADLQQEETYVCGGEGEEEGLAADFEDDFENDDYVRLNRKRNIPIRKTSFKRKANKSLSDEKLLLSSGSGGGNSTDLGPHASSSSTSSSNLLLGSFQAESGGNHHQLQPYQQQFYQQHQQQQNYLQQQQQQQQHRQLTKLSSDSNVLLTTSTTSSASLGFSSSSGYNTNSDSASSFAKLRLYDQQQQQPSMSEGLALQQQQQQFNRNLQHGQLQQRYSVSDEREGSSSAQQTSSSSTSTGPIQKAKATFRNIMGGKSSAAASSLNQESNGSNNKRLLKQSVSVKYGSEAGGVQFEDGFAAAAAAAATAGAGNYGGKSLSNSDLGVGGEQNYVANSAFYSAYQPQQHYHHQNSSQYDLLPSYQQQQPTLSHLVVAANTSSGGGGKLPSGGSGTAKSRFVGSNFQDGSNFKPQQQQQQQHQQQQPSFTLLSRHTIRKEEHFKSGEICAICENSILSSSMMGGGSSQPESHYKCTECRQLFHNKCFHLSSDIPCIKEGAAGGAGASSSASSSALAHGFGQGPHGNANYGNSSSGGNTGSSSFPVLNALNPSRPPRNKQKKLKNFSKSYAKENHEQHQARKDSSEKTQVAPSTSSNSGSGSKQSVRITQFTDPADILITDTDELQTMDKFITKKIREMEEGGRKKAKESMVDTVFKSALKDFKANLISTYSVGNYQEGYFRLTYKDLIDHFEQILHNVCQKEKTYTSFPVIMGVNAFRGYMDELRKLHNSRSSGSSDLKADKLNGGGNAYQGGGGGSGPGGGAGNAGSKSSSKSSAKQRKAASKKSRNRKKEDEVFTSYEHEFVLSMANIYTVCEVCSSYMWLMDKIWVCRRCKLTCHKKCAEKVHHTCRDGIGGGKGGAAALQSKVIFGAPLSKLVSEECRIPLIVEQLITKIELKGLYTEGIYRKSGTSSKINELKGAFDACGLDGLASGGLLDLDQYSVHVLAATLKLFFREMPEPLMTYELYDHFLWATTVSDAAERVQIILNHIGKLPKQNYDLLERLTFHLARVAQQESANRMNANSLAIVFAPCVLRTNKMMQMQEKLNDIGKQTKCIETIISERMRQISDTLNDIDILDVACHTASSRLSSIRHSKLNLSRDAIGLMRTTSNSVVDDEEEALLSQRIDELITEKQHLTTILPTFRLASACSDEDMLSSNEAEGDQQQQQQQQQQQHQLKTLNAGPGVNASNSDECLTAPGYHATSNSIGLPLKVSVTGSGGSGGHPQLITASATTTSTTATGSAMKPRVTQEQKGADYW